MAGEGESKGRRRSSPGRGFRRRAPCPEHTEIMIRLIFRFLLLAAAAAFFAWIADRPGTVVIRWMNREIETSVLAAAAGLVLAVLALWLSLGLIRRMIGAPGALGEYFRFRRARRGYES